MINVNIEIERGFFKINGKVMIGMIDLLNKLLSSDTENEVLEFKKAQNQIDKDKLGRYFTALSNEANLKNERSAYIILGVDNSKNILGTKRYAEWVLSLSKNEKEK